MISSTQFRVGQNVNTESLMAQFFPSSGSYYYYRESPKNQWFWKTSERGGRLYQHKVSPEVEYWHGGGNSRPTRAQALETTDPCGNNRSATSYGTKWSGSLSGLGCIFRRNSVYSGTFLSYPAELHCPMPLENGKGTERNSKGMCIYHRYSWSTYVFPT